jgi:hypothetical protein
MDQQNTAMSPANGESTAHELFALTDEQILEIEPEATKGVAQGESPEASSSSGPAATQGNDRRAGASRSNNTEAPSSTEHGSRDTGHDAQPGMAVPLEPPAWLAAQMKDPWSGQEARELWNGVQQARQEAAAYRAAIATPEDAKALKELYPGGVNEARAAADRARLLDQIDQAYFGIAGKPSEQTSAARAQLAAMMLREDPSAFREMVFAGLRALEEAEKGSGNLATASNLPRLAQIFGASRSGADVPAPGTRPDEVGRAASSSAVQQYSAQDAELKPAATQDVHQSLVPDYAAFEKSANEDLERSVGSAIEHTLEQALPAATKAGNGALKGRLSGAIRQDVEAALKGDRQLGEQIAQILSARRFDNETRAQVVRLIDERARQLVPSAAKRVLNEWTHTTLAAHRGNAARVDTSSSRREVASASPSDRMPVAPASPEVRRASLSANSQRRLEASAARPDSRRIDYRKLSDEQILDL